MAVSRKRKKAKASKQPKKAIAKLSAEDEALQILLGEYEKMMWEVVKRLETIDGLTNITQTTGYRAIDIETIALNFRKVAELIIYASLAGHKAEYDSIYPPQKHDWQIKLIIDRVKGINPDYYPRPHVETSKDKLGVIAYGNVPEGTWMTELELIDMYNRCGKLLHAEKGSSLEADYDGYLPLFTQWRNKLVKLLDQHVIILPDQKHSVWCRMNSTSPKYNGNPEALIFQLVPPDQLKKEIQA